MSGPTLDCFFVAPFGDKEHQMGGGTMPHFELVRSAVKEIMESFPDVAIRLRRADEIANVPSVQETFIGALQKADVVVAELSATGNANVFYELGIRFALRRAMTIPIWQIGTKVPADLQGLLGIEYEPTNPLAQREEFYKFLRSRMSRNITDSPVYRVLPDLYVGDASQIRELTVRVEELQKALAETRLNNAVQMTWDEAEGLLSKGDTGAALDALKIAYASAPSNIRLAIRYGQLLSRDGKHDEGIATLETAVAIAAEADGPRFIPFRELGMAYKRAGKAQMAIDWLSKAISENPRDSDTHGIIGGVHKDAYDIDKAIDSYQRGLDGDPKSTYCLLNILCLLLVRANTGDKLRFNRLLPTANILTAETLASKGADHWTMYDRAHYLMFANRGQEAEELFAKAIEITRTAGELRSARKNLDLLADAGKNMPSLSRVLSRFTTAEADLSK